MERGHTRLTLICPGTMHHFIARTSNNETLESMYLVCILAQLKFNTDTEKTHRLRVGRNYSRGVCVGGCLHNATVRMDEPSCIYCGLGEGMGGLSTGNRDRDLHYIHTFVFEELPTN